jgi:hypothetical protein
MDVCVVLVFVRILDGAKDSFMTTSVLNYKQLNEDGTRSLPKFSRVGKCVHDVDNRLDTARLAKCM